jgi:hypothetical protein
MQGNENILCWRDCKGLNINRMWKNDVYNLASQAGRAFGPIRAIYPHLGQKKPGKTLGIFSIGLRGPILLYLGLGKPPKPPVASQKKSKAFLMATGQ